MTDKNLILLITLFIIFIIICIPILVKVRENRLLEEYLQLEKSVLDKLKLNDWKYESADKVIHVKSKQAVSNYTDIKFIKENDISLDNLTNILNKKIEYKQLLNNLLLDNEFSTDKQWYKLEYKIKDNINNCNSYNVLVSYVSPAGNSREQMIIHITMNRINYLKNNPQELMTKGEYSKYLKEQNAEKLKEKQSKYYDKVNTIIDFANNNRDLLIVEEDKTRLDNLISQLFDKTVNNISKIKDINSEQWSVIKNYITNITEEINKLVLKTQQVLNYYKSPQFIQIKNTCNSLMYSQKEFNEYIDEKAQSISKLFGTRVVRTETQIDDEYNYIRPYKKSITPFIAEVSAGVFASAENSPIEYVIKYFYPTKDKWPEQIQKLQTLIEELETLKEAKQIIENYKKEYQQYIQEVPDYVLKYDSDGFYSRLGFATINENILTVEYKFSYTSNGGFSQRSFTVPMTEETIVTLIETLQNKLNLSSFSKEQRRLMTSKLRQKIKERDNFTCKYCGNSIYKEPNLLLEVDHIIPVAKGGYTVEDNLQTLCWKCNRHKSDNIV